MQNEFNAEVDLYDDVIAAPSESHDRSDISTPASQIDRVESHDTNGGFAHIGNNLAPNHIGRRHQLYVGNLTWVSFVLQFLFFLLYFMKITKMFLFIICSV